MISVILFKMGKHSDFHLSFLQIVGACRDFTVVTKLMKNLRVYMVLGDAVSKLETFVWILSHNSRSITWSLFIPKSSYLVKWSISTWSFMWWCQVIDWLKFETRPSSLLNFRMAYLGKIGLSHLLISDHGDLSFLLCFWKQCLVENIQWKFQKYSSVTLISEESL